MARLSSRMLIAVGAIGLAGIAGGCTSIRDHQGFMADQALVASVQPGVDNRESVQKTLGRPSFVGQFDESEWFYVTRETRAFAFGMPKPASQQVMRVRFDKAGNVVAVDRSGLEKVASVSPVGDKTPTLGRNRGFFAELFGNVGRVGGIGGQAASTADNPN